MKIPKMVRPIYLFIVCFSIGVTIMAQTPEQPYFEWTSLPFSKEELTQRREKLCHQLQTEGKSGLVVIPARDGFSSGETFRQTDDFYYFTGLELPNSILVLDIEKGASVVYTPKRDKRFESISRPNDFPGRPLLADKAISERTGISLMGIEHFADLMALHQKTGTTLWINSERAGAPSTPTVNYIATPSLEEHLMSVIKLKHTGLRFQNSYTAIARLRMIKSPTEIELMRKATAINVDGIKTAAKSVKPGVDERYLEGILEGNYKVNGAQRLAFGSIIKSGANSLWPWRILATHYNRRNRILEAGDLVIFDVGCEYNQYVSDVGRTFPVSGEFSSRQKEILEMEVGVAEQIIDFIKPGITFADIRGLTDRIIPQDAKKYMQVGLFFGHHLGLSTGDPNLPEATLAPGMIFTVEPWYYNHDEQISVFTEEVILVTAKGCEVLSKDLPRSPEALEQLMTSD